MTNKGHKPFGLPAIADIEASSDLQELLTWLDDYAQCYEYSGATNEPLQKLYCDRAKQTCKDRIMAIGYAKLGECS